MKRQKIFSIFILMYFCSFLFAEQFSVDKVKLKEISRILFDADYLCLCKLYPEAYLKYLEVDNKIEAVIKNKIFYNKRINYIRKQMEFLDSITAEDLISVLQEATKSDNNINKSSPSVEEIRNRQEQQQRQDQIRQVQERQRRYDQMMRQREQQQRQYEQWRRNEIANAERKRQEEMRREEQRRRQEEQMRRLQQK